jgi:hypothetical protein
MNLYYGLGYYYPPYLSSQLSNLVLLLYLIHFQLMSIPESTYYSTSLTLTLSIYLSIYNI